MRVRVGVRVRVRVRVTVTVRVTVRVRDRVSVRVRVRVGVRVSLARVHLVLAQQHGAHLLDVGVEQLLEEGRRAHTEEDALLAQEVRVRPHVAHAGEHLGG